MTSAVHSGRVLAFIVNVLFSCAVEDSVFLHQSLCCGGQCVPTLFTVLWRTVGSYTFSLFWESAGQLVNWEYICGHDWEIILAIWQIGWVKADRQKYIKTKGQTYRHISRQSPEARKCPWHTDLHGYLGYRDWQSYRLVPHWHFTTVLWWASIFQYKLDTQRWHLIWPLSKLAVGWWVYIPH